MTSANQEAVRLKWVVHDALEGELVTHEQQYRARQKLWFEMLKQPPSSLYAPEASMSWRANAQPPPTTSMPQTLRASPPLTPNRARSPNSQSGRGSPTSTSRPPSRAASPSR